MPRLRIVLALTALFLAVCSSAGSLPPTPPLQPVLDIL